MFSVGFPIDIVFIDGNNIVIRISPALKRWRVPAMVFGVSRALELEAGSVIRGDTRVGSLDRFRTRGPTAPESFSSRRISICTLHESRSVWRRELMETRRAEQ
jgi:hypothetical protein